ncbi:unnamed protein product [Adineta steineri]|uniref:Uncharacterized protein n=1 Tax=Adineta steineri TaxID=433720 RepID=A0A813ZKV6_9BILA|nr:unnamed protein product [Adineta steineri]CAF0747494.1 unnamed protein product [Adineta steineri]CAF0805085.1 unnamed protein product [Adineta steineri]CAF0900503.1 unnamed protein product [Adineta steineri]CAF0901762.1 unnamed protein product [Adineta steineri]
MSLNELVDMYNQKLNYNGSRSTIATDPSHRTPQSTFTMNTGYDSSMADSRSAMMTDNNNNNLTFTQNASSTLIFDSDTSRFDLNDRVLAGEVVRPPPHNNQPRIERIKFADKLVFSSGEAEIDDYENNEEYNTKYPDIKPQLNIINAQQAQIPPVDMFTNPGEQIQRLIQQGKLKNFHGYINYPYNYLEPPWHFTEIEDQQGYVNHNPPRSHLTADDIENNTVDDTLDIQLPSGVPQEPISQDRYEIIPLPKMVYENYVPLIATRRIVYRRPQSNRASTDLTSQQTQNSSFTASKLPQVDEMTYKF